MNGYICFYKGKKIEIKAISSYQAQQQAKKVFNAKKGFDISVILSEVNNKVIIHKTNEF